MKKILSIIKKNNFAHIAKLTIPLTLVVFLIVDINIAHAGIIASSIIEGFVGVLGTIVGGLLSLAGTVMSIFSGLLLIIAGQFLDIMIVFSLNTDNIRNVTGIYVGWQIFRDLVNMVFIFILLYVGISTIIRAGSFEIKKILVRLILVAIFVNFSFYFTGFVIDIGNILAGSLYAAIAPDMGTVTAGIGGQFIENLSISQFKNQALEFSAWYGEGAMKSGIMSILNAVFYLFASFALFLGASLFIVRHVVLIFLLMLAPLAFAAAILDSTKQHWNKWVGQLMGATFVAPIYLLLIAVTLAISDSSVFTRTPASISTGDQLAGSFLSTPGLIVNYMIIIGLIIASYTVSKNISSTITSISGKFAGKVTGGVGGYVGRRTIGRAAKFANDSDWLKRNANREGGSRWNRMAGYGSRKAMSLTDSTSKASFDMRGGAMGSTLKSAGVDAGTASGRGGYVADRKNRVKKQVELGEQIGATAYTRAEREEIRDLERRKTEAIARGDSTEGIDEQLTGTREGYEGVKTRAITRGLARKRREADRLDDRNRFRIPGNTSETDFETAEKLRKGKSPFRKALEEMNDDGTMPGGGTPGGGTPGGGTPGGGTPGGGTPGGGP